MNQSKAFWLDLLQHTIRTFAISMMSAVTVSSAGTADGYLPVTQVHWVGGLLIGLTAAVISILTGLTSIVIPGADPDTVSWFPPKTPPVAPPPVVVYQPAPTPQPAPEPAPAPVKPPPTHLP